MAHETNSLEGKRILFFAPSFFGYELKIKAKMEEMGALVDFFDERSVSSAINRALLKVSPKIFTKKTNDYYNDIFKENKDNNYEYVLVIKCDMISSDILKQMKVVFKEAKFCLYLYDSISNIPDIESKFQYFDRVLSFDRSDSMGNEKIIFRPLFYLDEFRKEINSESLTCEDIDLSFLGTIHSDRYAILKKIERVCKEYNLIFFTFKYLQSRFIYYVYKTIKKEFRDTKISDFSFEKMETGDISNIVSRSKVILDIEHPKQTGLTMRTIEMIGMQKKLITTNKDIINYDFYYPHNILVISRENPELPYEFFNSSYRALDKNVYEKYNIENWIRDILDI